MPVGIVLTFSAAFFAFCAAFFSAFRIVFSSDVSFAIAPSHADPSFRTIVARQPRGEDGKSSLKGEQRTPTRPDGKIEALFRFYGPQQALFDKTWALHVIQGNRNVRFGSLADIEVRTRDVRFTPKTGHCRRRHQCQLSVRSEGLS